jgi:DNA-binding CsgD family transcriptional regulator
VERRVDVSRQRAKAKRPIGRIQSLLHEEVLELRELVQQEEGKMKGRIDVQRLLAVQADRSGPRKGLTARFARKLHDSAVASLIDVEMQIDALRRQEADRPIGAELARIQGLLCEEVLKLRELMQQQMEQDEGPIDPQVGFDEVQKKFGLNQRELWIISAVVAGYTDREIADYLHLNLGGVERHLSRIFGKLGISTREELVRFAVNQGLPLIHAKGKQTISIRRGARVFLLDDDDVRIQWFLERLISITIAKEAPDAIAILDSYPPFDFVFLDHDLGRFTGTEGDGLQVAQHLARRGSDGHNTVIHSMNAAKTAAMKDALKSATVAPFGQFEIETV